MNDSPQAIVALVDDDSIFQLTASRMLKSTHLTSSVLQFLNGEEALRYLNENSHNATILPDILLLDINMPYVDGWMFLSDYAELKLKLKKEILIYMVSSSIDPADINRAKANHSVKDYLVKPISREGFEQLLKQFSDRSSN